MNHKNYKLPAIESSIENILFKNKDHVKWGVLYLKLFRYLCIKKAIGLKSEENPHHYELSIRQKNILSYVLIAAALLFLINSLISYRTYKQKQYYNNSASANWKHSNRSMPPRRYLKGKTKSKQDWPKIYTMDWEECYPV